MPTGRESPETGNVVMVVGSLYLQFVSANGRKCRSNGVMYHRRGVFFFDVELEPGKLSRT